MTTLQDIEDRVIATLTILAEVPERVNALNDSYNLFETALGELEEAALRKSELTLNAFSFSVLFKTKMFTNRILVYVQAMMLTISELSDVSTIPPSTANRVAKQCVDLGLSGHHGLAVQKHVVMGRDYVREPLPGTMRLHSLKNKRRTAIQKLVLIGEIGNPGDLVLSHVTRMVNQNQFKIDIDAG